MDQGQAQDPAFVRWLRGTRPAPRPLALVGAGLVALLLLAAPVLARSPAVQRWLPAASAGPADADCGDQPYADVDIDTWPRVWLELARTTEQRTRGLMFRPQMDADSGMLFDFGTQSQSGFWMHNTLIPLSIAWLDRDGTIVDIQDMQPQTDDVHTPSAPYWYALEVNQGWFEAHGVGVGQRLLFCLGAP